MKVIHNWIKTGNNFFVGVAIYKTVGTDDQLKALFAKGKTGYSEKRLFEELSAIIEETKPNTSLPKLPDEVIPESADPILKAIRNAWLPLYQRLNYQRHQLDRYTGNSPEMIVIRRPMAFEILNLEQECNAHWKQADEYQKTGKVPSAEIKDDMVVPNDPVERAKAIENTKRNIRRNRLELEKNPAKVELATRYNAYKDFFFRLTGNQYQESV